MAVALDLALTDSCNRRMNEDGKPVTALKVDFSDVDGMFLQRIPDMLRKDKHIWNVRMYHTKVAEYAIDLNYGAKPFKSAPCLPGPTAQ